MNTRELETAVKLCQSSLHNLDLIPILNHICFTGDTVYAYNDLSAVVVDCATGIKAGVQGSNLLGVLSTLGKECELSMVDGNVMISSGKAKVKLASLPEESFMYVAPNEKSLFEVTMDEELLSGFVRCSKTVGINALQREFTGMTVALNDGLRIYSTDDVRLSSYAYPEPVEGKARSWLLPLPSCKQIVDICNFVGFDEDAEITLHFGKQWAWLQAPGIFFATKLMPEAPPDYEAMIQNIAPDEDAWRAVPAGLQKACERADVLTAKETQPKVLFRVSENKLYVSLDDSVAAGSFKESFKYKEGDGVSLWMEPSKMASALAGASTMAVGERCIAVCHEHYLCCIAPVMVEGEG